MHVPVTLPLVGVLQGTLPHPDFSAEAYLAHRVFTAPRDGTHLLKLQLRAGTGITGTLDALGIVWSSSAVPPEDTSAVLATRTFLPHPPRLPDVRAGANVTVTSDALGYVVASTGGAATAVSWGRYFMVMGG